MAEFWIRTGIAASKSSEPVIQARVAIPWTERRVGFPNPDCQTRFHSIEMRLATLLSADDIATSIAGKLNDL